MARIPDRPTTRGRAYRGGRGMKRIKTLRDILGSGWSALNISTEIAHRTGLPENLVEQIRTPMVNANYLQKLNRMRL